MIRRASSWLCGLIVLLSATLCCGRSSQPTAPPAGYVLTWSDEFTGTNGSLPDSSKWVMETGGNGWGNNELESYTNRTQNVHVQNGNLGITANKGKYTGADGIAREYTSARLKAAGLFEQKYGRFEARIKIPQGQGIWPAFWMLGNNIDKAG